MRDLIFLHGGSHGSWCWGPLLAELRKKPGRHGRLITLDMPGCGTKRGRDTATLTLAAIARELNDDLRREKVSGAVLVGHSIAGALMPVMALEGPALFSTLVHLATSAPQEGQSVTQMMGTSVQGSSPDEVGYPLDPKTTPLPKLFAAMFGPGLSAEQLEWLLGEVGRDSMPPALVNEAVTRQGYDALRLETLYVLTKRDPILPPAWQRRFAGRFGAGRIVEIDTPHEPFVSHPALLADTLRGLVAA